MDVKTSLDLVRDQLDLAAKSIDGAAEFGRGVRAAWDEANETALSAEVTFNWIGGLMVASQRQALALAVLTDIVEGICESVDRVTD